VPRVVGDTVVFRVEGDRAVMARTPDFVSLAGTIEVPRARRRADWGDVVREVRSARAKHRR
jgi:antitoxin PrlF